MRSVTRTQPDRGGRRDAIRETLSDAVERLTRAGVPYSEVSVERLCQEVGTSRATFYQYFQDKGDLLSAMAEAKLRSFGDTTDFWWHLPPRSGKDALRVAFRQTFQLYREHSGVMRSLSETAAYDQAMGERLEAIVAWAIGETTQHIQDGIAGGTIRPDVDPVVTAEWLCWMFERGLYAVAGDLDEQHLEPMVIALTEIIWNTLYRGM